jgi:hypothetical protein
MKKCPSCYIGKCTKPAAIAAEAAAIEGLLTTRPEPTLLTLSQRAESPQDNSGFPK